ncbi:Non-structural maintenance of chromosome element 4 [Phlyctema vagabunda]|uniref:Non-structural maintenance of chromosomes element 4 n=1 Tax=Phlyctema vagabunda TaxID=108571 RepID=A0ABR4P712_9HELO
MPRVTKVSESPAPFQDLYGASPAPSGSHRQARPPAPSMSPSPAASASSDKENRRTRTVNGGKDRTRAPMAPPRQPSPAAKRKRGLEDASREMNQRRRTMETGEPDDDDGEDTYDPDQDIEERRVLRKELRFLSKELMDNRSEYLKPASTGLLETLQKANTLSHSVKQTADATIDSRLLVNAADLSYRRTLALTTGDISQGVDVDEFVSKCITFMKRARGSERIQQAQTQTQNSTQRRRRANVDDGSDGEGDEGDMLNWEHLGRFACLPNNSRPSVPGFLLGPLSQEKRARKAAVRKAALRPDKSQETRPEVLEAADIAQSHDTNLTLLCQRIMKSLQKASIQACAAAQAEEDASEYMTEAEQDALMDRHGINRDLDISFFKFVINPQSFGQTVENMFYVSFLIRDGKIGIKIDNNGLPFLEIINAEEKNERSDTGAQKHQAILTIDMDSWETLIELFDIKESMIPHRKEVVQSTIGARGWYN